MAEQLGWTVTERDGRAVIAVAGTLDLPSTPLLRTALLKCLADQPGALLVDLSGMELRDPTALALFSAVAAQAARWPGTPVLLCAPSPQTRDLLERRRYGRLPLHPSVAEALRAVDTGGAALPAISDQLLPVAGAARHARDLATGACLTWNLPELVGPVCLVVSELVSNAVEHAGTMMNLQVARRDRYVHVAVRDGSRAEPRLDPPTDPTAPKGRGLMVVESLTVHWGSLPSHDGKVVWAVLAAR
jgi:anti-anti-sigma factor